MPGGLHWSAWLRCSDLPASLSRWTKLSPGLVAGMFLSVLAFGFFAELGGFTYKGDKL